MRNSWKKEVQGNRYDEDEDERVPVVPEMEAGSSYLQTTYPRDEVEKIVVDGLEERTTGRGSENFRRRMAEGRARGARVAGENNKRDRKALWGAAKSARRRETARNTHRKVERTVLIPPDHLPKN